MKDINFLEIKKTTQKNKILIPKKIVKKAVERNKIKRRIKHVLRENKQKEMIKIKINKNIFKKDFFELKSDIEKKINRE